MRNLDDIARALRDVVPVRGGITGIRALTAGYSNETYWIEGPDLILRLPPAAGSMLQGRDVVGQAEAYEQLATVAGAPPVPEVVTIGHDASVLGVPFFVMKRVDGDTVDDIHMAPWFVSGTDAVREHTCREWVSAFARLSTMAALPVFGPAVSPDDDARTWRAFAQAADCPQLVRAYDRLLSVSAPLSGPPAIVHGDPKLSNLMWRDGKIVAMLDWEMAFNGEPLANLGYMLFSFASPHHDAVRAPKLPGMLSRNAVIALWSEVSGRSTDGLFWHEVAQCAKITAIVAEGANMHKTGRSSDSKLLIFADSLRYYLGVLEKMLDDGDGAFPKGTT